jgi:AAA15 family ATPase/GTPase
MKNNFMLTNLKIQNYRILENITFNELSHVNLIVGRNNVGKSSVLEAVKLFSKLGSPIVMSKFLDERNNNATSPDSYLAVEHFFTNKQLESKIYIGDIDKNNYIEIERLFYLKQGMEEVENLISLGELNLGELNIKKLSNLKELLSDKEIGNSLPQDITGNEKEKIKVTCTNVFLKKPNVAKRFTPQGILIKNIYFKTYDESDYQKEESRLIKNTPIEYSVTYIPTGLIPFSELSASWDSVSLTEKEGAVINALKLIEPRIERLNFINSSRHKSRIAVVKLVDTSEPVPLKSLGDGMSRVLQLILSILQIEENGFLLIDEFENGLHYSVQPKIWDLLFKLAEQYKIQVFATTHSKDCVESFGEIWKKYEGKGSFHRLSFKENKLRAISYDCETLSDAIESDIEVR